MTTSLPQTFRISPEANLKIRLISAHTGVPMCQIFEDLIEKYWNEQSDNEIKPINRCKKRARQILKKIDLTDLSYNGLDR